MAFSNETKTVLNQVWERVLREHGAPNGLSFDFANQLEGEIGSSFNSNIADGASAIGFTFNTGALTTAGAKLVSFQNAGTEKLFIDKDGNVIGGSDVSRSNLGSTAIRFDRLYALSWRDSANNSRFALNGRNEYLGAATDGASAIAHYFNSTALANGNAKLAQFDNNGATKFSIFADGTISGTGPASFSGSITPSVSKGANLGSSSLPYNRLYAVQMMDEAGNVRVTHTNFSASTYLGQAADGASAVSLIFETPVSYTTAGSKIISFRNNGSEKANIDKDGAIASTAYYTAPSGFADTYWNKTPANAGLLKSQVPDGASAVAWASDTSNAFSTSGAKLWSFRNNGVEKISIDKDGGMTMLGGISAGANIYAPGFLGSGTSAATLRGAVADGASAIGLKIGNTNALSTAGAKIVSFYNDSLTTEKVYITKDGDFVPTADNASKLGGSSLRFSQVYTVNVTDASANNRINIASSSANFYIGTVPDGATAISHKFGNTAGLSTAGAKIASFYSDNLTTEKAYIDKDGAAVLANGKASIQSSGKLTVDWTDASGTPGNVTMNKPSGLVSVALGASTIVVTNNVVTANSIVIAVLQDAADAIYVRSVVPAAGSFTVTLSGITTAARKLGFIVLN